MKRATAPALLVVALLLLTGCQPIAGLFGDRSVGGIALLWTEGQCPPTDDPCTPSYSTVDLYSAVSAPLLFSDDTTWEAWQAAIPAPLQPSAEDIEPDFAHEVIVVASYDDCVIDPTVFHEGDGTLRFAAVAREDVACESSPRTVVAMTVPLGDLGVDAAHVTLTNAGEPQLDAPREVGDLVELWNSEYGSVDSDTAEAVRSLIPDRYEPLLFTDAASWDAWINELPEPLELPQTTRFYDFNNISIVVGFYENCQMRPVVFDRGDGDLVFTPVQDEPIDCAVSYPVVAIVKVSLSELEGDLTTLSVRRY